jgi:hypothetical protein
VEGFLSLRLRSLWFAALLGLLAPLCAGQDPASQNPPPENPAPQGQTPQNQAPAGQAPSNQSPPSQAPQTPAPPGESSSRDQSSSQDESSSQEQPAKSQTPPKPAPQNRNPQNQPRNQGSQNQSLITLDSNLTIFSVLAALNTCGYDQDLDISDVVRSNVRAELQRNLRDSEQAEAARTALCEFYQGHVASRDANRNLSQYI